MRKTILRQAQDRLLITLAMALALASCNPSTGSGHAEPSPLRVKVHIIHNDTTICRHTYIGEVEEQNSIIVSAQSAGLVVCNAAQNGMRVHAGDALAWIDSTQAVNARLSAQATLEQAEDGYRRAMQVYAEGGLTEQKRIEIETRLTQARTMMAAADKAVKDCVIKAPSDGVITECMIRQGQSVAPGIPLLRLMNIDGYVVRFSVPESEITKIQVGEEAHMNIPATGESNLRIRITEKSLIANRIAHTYDIKAQSLDRATLMPGMMAKVVMEKDRQVGIILPQACIQMLPDGARVWISKDGKAQRKTIGIGGYADNGVLVTNGLEIGDHVVIEGYQKLYQNAAIREE